MGQLNWAQAGQHSSRVVPSDTLSECVLLSQIPFTGDQKRLCVPRVTLLTISCFPQAAQEPLAASS